MLWVQPCGLSLSIDGSELYVADSESSTVRSCDAASGAGRPHVGGDALFSDNLFRFGDRHASLRPSLTTVLLPQHVSLGMFICMLRPCIIGQQSLRAALARAAELLQCLWCVLSICIMPCRVVSQSALWP